MEHPEVVMDEFGVQTVIVSLEELKDFPTFIQFVVDNKIGEKQGIFKMRQRGGFNKEHAESVLRKVQAALNLHSYSNGKNKKNSKSSGMKPQSQCFHPVSTNDNIFIYRLCETSQDERRAFQNQFSKFNLSTENNTCCSEKLKDGRTDLLNHYWLTVRSGDASVMYGASVTIKPEKSTDTIEVAKGFSLSHLNTCLKFMAKNVSGISFPRFHLGLIHASFAWHIEDAALWSISYLHLGAPKVWFAVPAANYGAFESLMCRLGFPEAYKLCRNILGHKCFLVDPFIIIRFGIPVHMVVQQRGEFVVTRPFAAHSWFNCGLNIGEAANFASPDWLPLGMIAPTCLCFKERVNLYFTNIIKNCRPDLIQSYKSGNCHEAFPVASDPYSAGMLSEPASTIGILGNSSEPVQFLSYVKKELDEDVPSVCGAYNVQAETSEIIQVEDSTDEEELYLEDDNSTKPAQLLESHACPKTYAGGFAKLDRLKQHAVKYHLQSNPDIEKIINQKCGLQNRKFKTERGEACLLCGKFIRGSSAHAKNHQKICKKKLI